MPINNLPIETSFYSSYYSKDTQEKIQEAFIRGELTKINVDLKNTDEDAFVINAVIGGNASSDVIPFFHQPMSVAVGVGGKKEIVIDLRAFGRWNAPTAKFNVTQKSAYLWEMQRAALTHIWINGGVEHMRGIALVPASLYASLIAETATRRFLLDNREKQVVSVLSAYFFYGLFTNDTGLSEIAHNRMAAMIAKAVKAPAETVYEIIEGLGVMKNAEALCEAIKLRTHNVTLENFNIATFTALINNNWIGNNGRLTMMVGMEHVPTWIALTYAALADASFSRTTLTKLAQSHVQRALAEQFSKTIAHDLAGLDSLFVIER